jgi:hypothetical protein
LYLSSKNFKLSEAKTCVGPNKKQVATQNVIKTSLIVKIPAVLIKKTGINPPFWHKRKSFLSSMQNIYHNVRRSWQKQIKL